MGKTTLTALLLAVILGWSITAEAAKENFDRSKPHVSVSVKTSGVDMGGFRQMDGFGLQIEVIEYQDGEDRVLRKRPGR